MCSFIAEGSKWAVVRELLEMAWKFEPKVPRKCPVLKQRFDFETFISLLKDEKYEAYKNSIFYSMVKFPNGQYKVVLRGRTKEDPEVVEAVMKFSLDYRMGDMDF
jgi:hypothetical protein